MTVAARYLKIKSFLFIHAQKIIIPVFGGFRPGSILTRTVMRFSRFFAGPLPYVIKLDITKRCNIHCAMCYVDHSSQDMPLERIRTILSQFRHIPVRIDLMGGEPFMHRQFNNILCTAKKSGVREIVAYTNATLITPDAARAAKQAGLGKAMVNISSYDQGAHDRFTGTPGSWEKTIEGIKNLKAAGIQTYAFIVLHKENILQYDRLREFARNTLQTKAVFYHYIPTRNDDALTPDPGAWNSIKHRILYENGFSHRKTISRINAFCGRSCLGAYYSFSVKINGDITPCPFISDLVIGNIFTDSFWNIFSRRMKNSTYRQFMSTPEDCSVCTYKGVCAGGCRAGNGSGGFYAHRDIRCMGPWKEPFDADRMHDRMPMFF